jgi:hypothetical protein
MRPRRPLLRRDLLELPGGCEELQATTAPTDNTRLHAHLDCLPGLGIEEINLLVDFAEKTVPPAQDDGTVDPSQRVLGLDDLLRTHMRGFHALHPRVQQVIPVGTIDWLLETIAKRLDIRTDTLSYQYPHYLFECRGAAPDRTSLHAPQYHIRTLDVVRELRSNDILTTVCQGGTPIPDSESIADAVDAMEAGNDSVVGVFTLRGEPSDPEPALIYHDDIAYSNGPSQAELFEHCKMLLADFGVTCRLVESSTYRTEVDDD